MRFLRQLLNFFVYSNLFIAGCAIVMVIQTFHFLLDSPADFPYTAFVFFSTLCSYSFHWYLTDHSVLPSPRINWLLKYKYVHVTGFVIGITGSAYYFFQLLPHWHWLLMAAIITFLYSAPKIPHPVFRSLRKVALGKTIFLAFAWMFVTTVLPVEVTGKPWNTGYTLFCIQRFFQVYCICILFDYRDREDDKADGIRSLITFLSEKGILRLFIFSTLAFIVSTLFMLQEGHRIPDIIVLLIPGLITAGLFKHAHKDFSDLFFYLLLDGLMALSAIIMLVARI